MASSFDRAAGINGQSRAKKIRLIGLVITTRVTNKARFYHFLLIRDERSKPVFISYPQPATCSFETFWTTFLEVIVINFL